MPAEEGLEVVLSDLRDRLEQRLRREHEPRCAKGALEGMLVEERLLHRVQAVGEPFDGGDLSSVEPEGRREAGADGRTVKQDGAGATDAEGAGFTHAEEPGLSQHVDGGRERLAVEPQLAPVHDDFNPQDRPPLRARRAHVQASAAIA